MFCIITVPKFLQNSQENTSVGVSYLVKLQSEKVLKIHKKIPAPSLDYIKLQAGGVVNRARNGYDTVGNIKVYSIDSFN